MIDQYHPHPTNSTTINNNNNKMSQPRSATDPHPPNMPKRPDRNTDDILHMGNDHTSADTATEIMALWNEWADSVEVILNGLTDLMEELAVSYDDYLTCVAHFATYPARPALPAAESGESSGRFLGCAWSEWANVVESIVGDMKWSVDHSGPLPRDQQRLCAGERVDFSLDLSNQDLPPMHMATHLRKMLQDGTVAREEVVEASAHLA